MCVLELRDDSDVPRMKLGHLEAFLPERNTEVIELLGLTVRCVHDLGAVRYRP